MCKRDGTSSHQRWFVEKDQELSLNRGSQLKRGGSEEDCSGRYGQYLNSVSIFEV